GYERVETLRTLEGKIQVWLPDLKYADSALAAQYSGAADYFPAAAAAIQEMHRQVGDYVLENGLLRRGVLIRHLLLPGALENAKAVMDWVAGTFRPGQVLFSLMAQYTPQPGAQGLLGRRVTGAEYRSALAYLENLGIVDGYCQDAASAQAEYTPAFDLTGVAEEADGA
ncbi:MAG: radical SAM protein, partial [Oscillospiraceae bacterium]|nr:radical SAM protein [Oscillospiraceae bacterium]